MRGFSLVELSIVLVILGLLTGGILSGQSLIRAAEIRSLATQYGQHVAAIHSFSDKYMALPGDMREATRFWGKDNTNCPGHTGTTAADGVCNGDGNGSVLLVTGGAGSTTQEAFQFWRHLAKAGLVEGSYTGIAGAARSSESVFGVNVPHARISNAGWGVRDYGSTAAAHFALSSLGNHLAVGRLDGSGWPHEAALRPEEAWNIDTKMDDGKPARGRVFAPQWQNCTTATARTELTAEYNVSDSTLRCGLWMKW